MNTGKRRCKSNNTAGHGARRRSALLTVCMTLLVAGWLFFGAQTASAMTCYIDAQPEQAEVGQDVTVTLVFSGDNVGRVRATLEYDKSVLSYQGEGGDTGEVSLYMASDGDGIYYSLPFKAAGEGSSYLTMTPLDAYDMDEMNISLPEAQSMSVSVKAAQTAPQPAETQKEEEPKTDPAAEAKDDPQKDKEDPAKTDGKATEKTDKAPRSNTTVFILLGIAVILAVALIIVLVKRSKSRYNK